MSIFEHSRTGVMPAAFDQLVHLAMDLPHRPRRDSDAGVSLSAAATVPTDGNPETTETRQQQQQQQQQQQRLHRRIAMDFTERGGEGGGGGGTSAAAWEGDEEEERPEAGEEDGETEERMNGSSPELLSSVSPEHLDPQSLAQTLIRESPSLNLEAKQDLLLRV